MINIVSAIRSYLVFSVNTGFCVNVLNGLKLSKEEKPNSQTICEDVISLNQPQIPLKFHLKGAF